MLGDDDDILQKRSEGRGVSGRDFAPTTVYEGLNICLGYDTIARDFIRQFLILPVHVRVGK